MGQSMAVILWAKDYSPRSLIFILQVPFAKLLGDSLQTGESHKHTLSTQDGVSFRSYFTAMCGKSTFAVYNMFTSTYLCNYRDCSINHQMSDENAIFRTEWLEKDSSLCAKSNALR